MTKPVAIKRRKRLKNREKFVLGRFTNLMLTDLLIESRRNKR
jgi:hypothetical protein